jgi:hypothetical protein
VSINYPWQFHGSWDNAAEVPLGRVSFSGPEQGLAHQGAQGDLQITFSNGNGGGSSPGGSIRSTRSGRATVRPGSGMNAVEMGTNSGESQSGRQAPDGIGSDAARYEGGHGDWVQGVEFVLWVTAAKALWRVGRAAVGWAAARYALWRAGFSREGLPLIVDESIGVVGGPNAAAQALREAGFNARSVLEIYGRGGIQDPQIAGLARQIGGRVVTYDKGAQLGQGFGQLAIRPKGVIRDPTELVRFVQGALGP